MKRILPLVTLIIVLAACSPRVTLPDIMPTPTPSPRPPAVKPEDYSDYDIVSRLDGSTATIPLSEGILLERFGTAAGLTHNRTHEAYARLIGGESDLIFVTYPSEAELELAETAGVELEIIPVVKDALVFLRNTANGVESLSRRQIRGIYTGGITNWSEIGGADEPITAFQRPENSGSQTLFLKLAMDGLAPSPPPLELRPAGMGDLVDAVADYDNAPGALGFSVFYYVSDMYGSPNVTLMAVDGVAPTRYTIAAGTYPYITYYYAVMRKDTPEGHPMRELIGWLLTDEGQAAARRAGYVPMRALNRGLDESGYGFYGSTPENTAVSSGTGGTEPLVEDLFSDRWGVLNNGEADLSSEPETERMVRAWVEQAMESYGAYGGNISAETVYELAGDLLSVRVFAYDRSGESKFSRAAAAVFDLKEGRRLRLSDLFYDGVNYIEYINANMITRSVYSYADHTDFNEYFLKRPFTGVPDDYAEFTIANNSNGSVLQIYIENDNPFFDYPYASAMLFGLRLPLDLSPYGLVYDIGYDREDISGSIEMLIPRIQTGAAPSQVDGIINGKIRALAETAAENVYIGDVSDIDGGVRYIPDVSFWNDNMSVRYNDYYWTDDIYTDRGFTITVNLRTGGTVDAEE